MADQQAVVSSGRINDAALRETYGFILRTLGESGLKATAAFVSCFAAGTDAVRAQMATLEQLAGLSPEWFAHLLPALKAGRSDGWDGASHYRALTQAGHEMAWHGATHMPLTHRHPGEAVELEIQLAQALFADLGHTPETIVFPRNRVGHLGRCCALRASRPTAPARRVGLRGGWAAWRTNGMCLTSAWRPSRWEWMAGMCRRPASS